MQIFKAGTLVHTAPASLHFQQSAEELPFCRASDGQISFQLNQVVQGDILLRCRHLTARKQRVSMFRAAFHTGYAPPNVMRLTKSQLDGGCTDDRFPDDFYIDIIFEPIDAAEASKALKEGEIETAEEEDHPSVEVTGSKEAQALAGGATTGKLVAVYMYAEVLFLFCVHLTCRLASILQFELRRTTLCSIVILVSGK